MCPVGWKGKRDGGRQALPRGPEDGAELSDESSPVKDKPYR